MKNKIQLEEGRSYYVDYLSNIVKIKLLYVGDQVIEYVFSDHENSPRVLKTKEFKKTFKVIEEAKETIHTTTGQTVQLPYSLEY